MTLWGTSDGAILQLYPDETYALELDSTLRTTRGAPSECAVTTTGAIYLSVSAGPLNRTGAVFLMMVR